MVLRHIRFVAFWQLFLVCSLLSGSVFITAGKAQLPGVNLGATSFLDGLPPPGGPGWYVEEYFQYYNSSRLLDNDGNEVALPTSRGTFETPHVQDWVMLTAIDLSIKPTDFTEGPVGPQPYGSRRGDRRESRRFHRVPGAILLFWRYLLWPLHPMGSHRRKTRTVFCSAYRVRRGLSDGNLRLSQAGQCREQYFQLQSLLGRNSVPASQVERVVAPPLSLELDEF